jgi:hypothetical protein
VPPEPAAPLVALTIGGANLATTSRRRRGRGVLAAISAAATVVVVVGAIAIITAVTGSGAQHQRSVAPPAAREPVSPSTTSPPAAAVLIDSNSQGARYSVAPSAASINLVASSSCWVQLRTASANGPVLFQGTMHAGDRMPLPTGGPVWLRLGNPPGISIVINGAPLHLLAPSVPQPYNLEFQPAS